jgi:glycosyltransferase involved in cell wall biosynthesis
MKRILAVVPAAYGGQGRMAQYFRDLLESSCTHPHVAEVVAVPVSAPLSPGVLPGKLNYYPPNSGVFSSFFFRLIHAIRDNPSPHLILCGHINVLLPCLFAQAFLKKNLVFIAARIETWKPEYKYLAPCLSRVAQIIVPSHTTLEALQKWAGHRPLPPTVILPNALRLNHYGIGLKNEKLLNRHNLAGKTVLMVSQGVGAEDASSQTIERIFEIFPEILTQIPTATCLLAGTGFDRPRIEQRIRALGLEAHFAFTGAIKESERIDYFRLAQAFMMLHCGELCSLVLLEAVACGVPVIGTTGDRSREFLLHGKLGATVDPTDTRELLHAICAGLRAPRPEFPPELYYYSFQNYVSRLHQILEGLL